MEEKEVNQNSSEQKDNNEDINALLPGAKPVCKPEKDSPAYDVVINEARLEFTKAYKKNRMLSYIMMAAVLAVAITSVVLVSNSNSVCKVIGWALIGAAVVGMLVYYFVSRNIMPGKTQDYIALVNKEFNGRNYSDDRFTEVMTDEKEKLELADFIADGVYKDLNTIASRNVIRGKCHQRSFVVADVGLYRGNTRKDRSSAFVGKYISYPNSLHFSDHYVINIKGPEAVDLPSIDGLEELMNVDNITIYGKKGAKPSEDLSKKFIESIKDIKLTEHILNVNISVWASNCAAYMSCSDQIMTLPFQTNYDKTSNEQFVETMLRILDAFVEINK